MFRASSYCINLCCYIFSLVSFSKRSVRNFTKDIDSIWKKSVKEKAKELKMIKNWISPWKVFTKYVTQFLKFLRIPTDALMRTCLQWEIVQILGRFFLFFDGFFMSLAILAMQLHKFATETKIDMSVFDDQNIMNCIQAVVKLGELNCELLSYLINSYYRHQGHAYNCNSWNQLSPIKRNKARNHLFSWKSEWKLWQHDLLGGNLTGRNSRPATPPCSKTLKVEPLKVKMKREFFFWIFMCFIFVKIFKRQKYRLNFLRSFSGNSCRKRYTGLRLLRPRPYG